MLFAETLAPSDPRVTVVTKDTDLAYWEKVLLDAFARRPGSGDTETSGFNVFQGAHIIGWCWGYDLGDGIGPRGLYIPIRHETSDAQCSPEHANTLAQKLLGNPNHQIPMHNAKFDLHFIQAEGIEVRAFIHDTMVMAALIDENEPKNLEHLVGRCGISSNAFLYKKAVAKAFTEECRIRGVKKREAPGYAWIPVGVLGPYGAFDGIHTLALFNTLYPQIQEHWWALYGTEMRLLRVLQKAEYLGMPIDVPYLEGLHQDCVQKEGQLTETIHRTAGYMFNPGSDGQVADLFYERLAQPVNYWGKTISGQDAYGNPIRNPSVGELALKDMIRNSGNETVRHLAQLLLDYRDANKIRTTYTEAIISRTDSKGVLHGSFEQVGTVTGRLSSKNPNLQNIPSQDTAGIRKAFLVPKGKTRVILDFSQIELRVLASLANEPTMMKAFVDGEDLHSATSLRMFGNQDKVNRRVAKVINFGVAYGMTAGGVMENLNKFADPERGIPVVTLGEAEAHLEKWHSLFPSVQGYIDQLVRDMCRYRPPAYTNLFGRSRRISGLLSVVKGERRRGIRQAVASMVQGTAAEMTKVSLVRAADLIARMNAEGRWEADIVSTIHDEIQIDVNHDSALECATMVKDIMEDFHQFKPVPIVADGEWTTTTWADKKDIWT